MKIIVFFSCLFSLNAFAQPGLSADLWQNDLSICPSIQSEVGGKAFIKEAYVTANCDQVMIVPQMDMYSFAFYEPIYDGDFSIDNCRVIDISEDYMQDVSYLYQLKAFRYSHSFYNLEKQGVNVRFPAEKFKVYYKIPKDKRKFKLEYFSQDLGLGETRFLFYAPEIVSCAIQKYIPDNILTYKMKASEKISYLDKTSHKLKTKDLSVNSEATFLLYNPAKPYGF